MALSEPRPQPRPQPPSAGITLHSLPRQNDPLHFGATPVELSDRRLHILVLVAETGEQVVWCFEHGPVWLAEAGMHKATEPEIRERANDHIEQYHPTHRLIER